jgi:2,4-dienoyl-CoA reductase-like NADH-dependent reductase (Old Yellow Enzyme family)
LAPSAIPFSDNYHNPKEMDEKDIKLVIEQFQKAAQRSLEAGFEIIEIHMAHGYLVHEFLSPISNNRTDRYGGNLENRCRFSIEISKAVREVIPSGTPLFVRISSTDWIESGWDIEQSVQLVKWLKDVGVDLIDCSSGGNIVNAKIPAAPGYQIPLAERIKKDANILTGGVGLITTAEQAEKIIAEDKTDIVLLAREMLRDPYWAFRAAKKLGIELTYWPKQYLRAK